jgi:hypothetical protein
MAMPDDMLHTADALLAEKPLVSSSTVGPGISKDQREKSCDFGSCTFVKTWYEKVNVHTEAGRNARAIGSALHADNCPKCDGMFFTTTSLLPRIKIHAKDKMDQLIHQVYLSGEDYTIYRTRHGVNVNFADCRLREREQRTYYAGISEKLCRLRFLTSQMARWPFGLSRLNRCGGFYDHQVAEAIYLALQGQPDKAVEILDEGLRLADDRITNENRVRYLIACLLVGLVPSIALWLLYRASVPVFDKSWMPYLVAASAGATGAVFSIAMRIQLESAEFSATFWRPVTCAHSRRATVR